VGTRPFEEGPKNQKKPWKLTLGSTGNLNWVRVTQGLGEHDKSKKTLLGFPQHRKGCFKPQRCAIKLVSWRDSSTDKKLLATPWSRKGCKNEGEKMKVAAKGVVTRNKGNGPQTT